MFSAFLSLQLRRHAVHLVGRGNHSRVHLERALRREHGDKLRREIHRRKLQRAGNDVTAAARTRQPHLRRAGVQRRQEKRIAERV